MNRAVSAFYFSSEQTSVPLRVTRVDESGSSCRVGECAFKWFLTHWRSIMPWKSLRWAASAYAHYLWEHAASWLHFQRLVHRVRESGNERCVCLHPQMKHCFSCVYGPFLCAVESVCVCAYVPTQYPVLSRFQTLIASSRNRQYLSLFSALAVSKLQ